MLRAKIQAVLDAAKGDTSETAIEICQVLEDEVGLSGNGWFDDDELMLSLFESDQDETDD